MEDTFKVVVVGDTSTGKTSFVKRSALNFFSSTYRATIGTDYSVKKVQLSDDTSLLLQLWDIAGQDRVRTISHVFYRHAAAALVFFDLSRRETLESARVWKSDIDEKIVQADGTTIPCFLIASKSDVRGVDAPSDREIDSFAEKNGIEMWFEVSAKTGAGIEAAILAISRHLARSATNSDGSTASTSSSASSSPSPRRANAPRLKDGDMRRKQSGGEVVLTEGKESGAVWNKCSSC